MWYRMENDVAYAKKLTHASHGTMAENLRKKVKHENFNKVPKTVINSAAVTSVNDPGWSWLCSNKFFIYLFAYILSRYLRLCKGFMYLTWLAENNQRTNIQHAVGDGRLCPRCRYLANWMKRMRRHWFWLIRPIMWKNIIIHKTGST